SQNNIDDKGYWDSGCSRHMTGNISYISDYEPFDGGYVSFGQGGCKITGKRTIKIGKLEFEKVYFGKDLKYNLFSVSQIYDNKNSGLFTDSECNVLGRDFKLLDDANVLLRTPMQHNMYTINLKNILPHKDLTCLVAKALADEGMLWHRRLGHLNFKTINRLVRHNLVRGLPSKCFENDHTYTTCLKRKQHKASCKFKLVNSVTKPLQTLHMDLFGPTSVSCINQKWYFLVVTDDFSRFTWTFFLKAKDETNGILRKFITEIENLKDLKVKIIRCDNGEEFKNKEMNEFCSQKGIKREFSNVRTPQQNGVAEKRNRTLIKAARTMLADAKLPVTFWDCLSLAIRFLKPFGCHFMILNTLDHLGKFEAKGDKGTNSTNLSGTKDAASQEVKKYVSYLRYIALPNWVHDALLETSLSKPQDNCSYDVPESSGDSNPTATSTNPSADQMETLAVETPIPTVSSPVLTDCFTDSQNPSSDTRLISKRVANQVETLSLDNNLTLRNWFEDILGVTTISDESNGVEADISNMETTITASPTSTLRIHKDHPKIQIIGPVDTLIQTRNKSKKVGEQSFIATIHQKIDPALLQFCLFSCFLSQKVWSLVDCPKGVRPIGTTWVPKNKKGERWIIIRNKARLVAQGHTQKEGIDYDEVFAPVARIEAIRLSLAYASFMGFTVYQMDVNSAFLYGTIDEGSMQQKLDELMALCTSLRRQQSEMVSREEVGCKEEAAERVSDDTAEMATVLTSMDAAIILASRLAEVPTGSGSIPTAGPPATEVPIGSDVVPTAGLIFSTAPVVTPYTRGKGKETMVESETPKKKKVQEQIDAQVARELEEKMAREDQRMSEQIARDAEIARIHAEEELNQAGWKAKDFKGMTLKEIKENFDSVWKKIHDFIPISSKEEVERFKRKGIRFKQESVKKLKTSEEVKASEEVLKEKNMMHALVEWKLYDSCRVHHVTSKDNESFMLIKKDYPLRKGLAIMINCYKLQVENYS
nr:hypothetical protein [Tanacetum cinerariifolium]